MIPERIYTNLPVKPAVISGMAEGIERSTESRTQGLRAQSSRQIQDLQDLHDLHDMHDPPALKLRWAKPVWPV